MPPPNGGRAPLEAPREVAPPAREALFRREALARLERIALQGTALRPEPRWLPWAYRALLAAFAGVIVLVSLAKVDVYADGPARACATGSAVAVVVAMPAYARAAVRPGAPLRVALRGPPPRYRDALITSVQNGAAGARCGVEASAGTIVVESRLIASSAGGGPESAELDGATGRATVKLGSRPLLFELAPKWGRLLASEP